LEFARGPGGGETSAGFVGVFACGAAFALLHVLVLQPWSILLPSLLTAAALIWCLLNLPLPRWQPRFSWLHRGPLRFAALGLAIVIPLSLLTRYLFLHSAEDFIGRSYEYDAAALFSLSFWLQHLLGTIRYFGANVIALAAVFPYAFVLTGQYLWRAFRAPHDGGAYSGPSLSLLVFFAGAVFFLVLLTAIATEVHSVTPFEANRFEGRYYIFLVPLLPAVLFGLGRDASPRAARVCAGVGLVTVCYFVYMISTTFNIFAGDLPESYAFFSVPNHLDWDYPKPWPLVLNHGAYISLSGAVLAAVAVLARPRLLVPAYGAFLTLIAFMGQAEVNAYMFMASNIIQWRADDARAIAQLLAPVHPGEGVIVANDRYEFVAPFVFSLRAPQWVLVRPTGAHLTEADLPANAVWVAAINDYVPDFRYQYSLKFEHTSLYVLNQSAPSMHEPEKLVWRGTEPIHLSFAGGKDAKTLMGFHPSEDWGAWSATDVATITLPKRVTGDIVLKINAGTLPQNVERPLRIEIGDAHAELLLKTDVLTYELRLAPDWPTDTIRLDMPALRPLNGDSRSLGVALSWIEISRP
jgi:hypothetical protein